MLQLRLVVTFFALALIILGGKGLSTIANQEPSQTTYVQFLKSNPTTGYVTLSGGSLNIAHSAAFTADNQPVTSGSSNCYYVAFQGWNELSGTPTRVMVKTSDPAIVSAAVAFHSATDGKSVSVARAYFHKHLKTLLVSTSPTGMVGLADPAAEDTVRSAVTQHVFNVSPKFIILDASRKPSDPLALVMLGVGLVAAIFAVVLWAKKDEPQAVPLPSSFGVTGPGTPTYTPNPDSPGVYGGGMPVTPPPAYLGDTGGRRPAGAAPADTSTAAGMGRYAGMGESQPSGRGGNRVEQPKTTAHDLSMPSDPTHSFWSDDAPAQSDKPAG